MTVDSGAFQTLVDKKFGKEVFGFTRLPTDKVEAYHTDSGSSGYVEKRLSMSFSGNKPIKVPVAWSVGKEKFDPAVGRAGVFKYYDILVSKTDKKVTFTAPPK